MTNIQELIAHGQTEEVISNLDQYIKEGEDPTSIVESLIDNDSSYLIFRNLDEILSLGIDQIRLIKKLLSRDITRSITHITKVYIEHDVDITQLQEIINFSSRLP